MLSHNIGARISDCSSCGNPLENYFPFDCTQSDILRRLPGLRGEWQDIPLQSPSTTVAQAKKDFRRQKVLLNGVAFTPELNSTNNNDLFSSALYKLCDTLLRLCPLPDARAPDVAESVMQRSCRSSTGADSFFAVHQLFSIQDTLVVQHEGEGSATIEISLFCRQGSLCARSDCKNSYMLVDASMMGHDEHPTPWLYVNTYIRDEINFKTGDHLRSLTIVPSEEPSDCSSVRPVGIAGPPRHKQHCSAETDVDTERDDREGNHRPS